MKQKQWVRITIVFFALIIVLTIFSRAAASVTKAKVTVTRAEKRMISHEIRLNGTVEAKDHFLQYVPSGLMVKSVKVSPGQQVEAGDILFTVDVQKLQEKIGEIEAEIASVKQREDLTISRAEEAYQDVKKNAEEEKNLAYRSYKKAVDAYNEYIATHEVRDPAEISDVEGTEGTVSDDSYYNEAVAGELKSAIEGAESAYEMTVRQQDKLIEAAEDSFLQTKEDVGLEQSAGELEDSLKELQPYLQNEGQYPAEHPGVVGRIFVEAGTETNAGVAALIADSTEGVRVVAEFPEEYRDDMTEASVITLRGENLAGGEETYTVSDVTISKNNTLESGMEDAYSLTSNIPGDLYPVGSSVTVLIDNKSEEYDTCIPLSCLRQNANYQYFVYVTEEQDTVLGKELVARELIVNVLDKNERYAAVEGAISGDVIDSTSKNIADGSRVIISE